MPAKTDRQRRFMWLVHGIQRGKISASKGGTAAKRAADTMNPKDVADYLMQECGLKKCGMESKRRILGVLKEIQEPMNLQEDETAAPTVIASSKTLHGDYEQTVKMYRGFEFTPKENQAIQNFDGARPVEHSKFLVKYSKSDDITNNSTIVVKKLKEKTGNFVYVALIKIRGGEEAEEPVEEPAPPPAQQNAQPPAQPPPQQPMREAEEPSAGDEIKVIKSIPIDDNEGSEILTNFLQLVYHKQA